MVSVVGSSYQVKNMHVTNLHPTVRAAAFPSQRLTVTINKLNYYYTLHSQMLASINKVLRDKINIRIKKYIDQCMTLPSNGLCMTV